MNTFLWALAFESTCRQFQNQMIPVSNWVLCYVDEVLGGKGDGKVLMGLLDGLKGGYFASKVSSLYVHCYLTRKSLMPTLNDMHFFFKLSHLHVHSLCASKRK